VTELLDEISIRLKTARESANLSRKEVSEKLNISVNTVGQYETAKREPPFVMLIKMAKLYNANLDFLLTGEMPPDEKDIKANKVEMSLLEAFRKLDDFTRGEIFGIMEKSIKK
jgi:transcriptional regulator with XRE-family HTH domain